MVGFNLNQPAKIPKLWNLCLQMHVCHPFNKEYACEHSPKTDIIHLKHIIHQKSDLSHSCLSFLVFVSAYAVKNGANSCNWRSSGCNLDAVVVTYLVFSLEQIEYFKSC